MWLLSFPCENFHHYSGAWNWKAFQYCRLWACGWGQMKIQSLTVVVLTQQCPEWWSAVLRRSLWWGNCPNLFRSILQSMEGSRQVTEICDPRRLQMEPLPQVVAYDINKCFLYRALPTTDETVKRNGVFLENRPNLQCPILHTCRLLRSFPH